jgi:hypothetical protein
LLYIIPSVQDIVVRPSLSSVSSPGYTLHPDCAGFD